MDKRWFTPLELSLFGVAALGLLVSALIGSNGDAQRRSDRLAGQPRSAIQRSPTTVKVAPIIRRVERLRGLRFRRPLKVTFASPARARSMLASNGSHKYPAHSQEVDEEELKLLGLLEPKDDLRRAFGAVVEEQVLGFYDFRSKRLVVVRQKADSRGLQEITLAHELTHALEDQHFGLKDEGGLGDDEALAEQALSEGTATALMSDYAERYLGLGDLLEVVQGLSGTDTKLPKFVESALVFPYEQGEKFVRAFRLGRSWRAVNKVLRLRHPRSTEQLLHPERYAIDERPVAVRLPSLASRLGTGWRRLDATSVGEFDLRTWFRQVGKAKAAAVAAKGWGGGRFELWRRGALPEPSCRAPCVGDDVAVMQLVWDTRPDRAEGEAALESVFQRGLGGKRIRGRAGMQMWSSRGGAIGMFGDRRRTTVAFAPSAVLAGRLLRASG